MALGSTNGEQWSQEACVEAASLGLLQELDRLQQLQPVAFWSEDIWTAAAAHGEVEVFHWLRSQEDPVYSIDVESSLLAAAENGHGRMCRSAVCLPAAAFYGHRCYGSHMYMLVTRPYWARCRLNDSWMCQ